MTTTAQSASSEAAAATLTFRERHSAAIEAIMQKYPRRRSGVMDVLYLVQREQGWISESMMTEVAEICGILPSEVMEMVTFYPMYHRKPVGEFVLNVCGTLPCALCGAHGLIAYLKEKLGVDPGETTEDGLFTVRRVECLGACSEAPMMLVNSRTEIRLTRTNVDAILERCRNESNNKAGARGADAS